MSVSKTELGGSNPSAPARILIAAMLRQAGAEVRHETLRAGHGLTEDDIALAAAWFKKRRRKA